MQLNLPPSPNFAQLLKHAIEQSEREIITWCLKHHGLNFSKSAIALGVDRKTLYNMCNRLGIKKENVFITEIK